MEDSTTDLYVAVTGSLSVNRYRWINIWTAILGHIFIPLPVFFEMPLILLLNGMEIFPDTVVNAHIYVLLFSCLMGIKRRARLIPISTRHFLRVATSSRAKTFALACWFVLLSMWGDRGGDTR